MAAFLVQDWNCFSVGLGWRRVNQRFSALLRTRRGVRQCLPFPCLKDNGVPGCGVQWTVRSRDTVQSCPLPTWVSGFGR